MAAAVAFVILHQVCHGFGITDWDLPILESRPCS